MKLRKMIVIGSLVGSGLMILDSLNAGHAFMMFFLAGIIPGTNLSISASGMLSAFMFAIGFVIARLTSRQLSKVITSRLAQAKA